VFSSISIRTSGPITNADICPNASIDTTELVTCMRLWGTWYISHRCNYVTSRTHILVFGGVVKNEMVLNLHESTVNSCLRILLNIQQANKWLNNPTFNCGKNEIREPTKPSSTKNSASRSSYSNSDGTTVSFAYRLWYSVIALGLAYNVLNSEESGKASVSALYMKR
jgi:hypothetical protein